MEIVIKLMQKIESVVDKFAHFGIGALIAAVLVLALLAFDVPPQAGAVVAGIVVLLAALGREAYGKTRGSVVSAADIIATMAGWLSVAAVALLT
jgi:predicted membrane channel-forming protein YqfA (hemolysin III family)